MAKPKWMHPLFHGTPKEMTPFTPEERGEDPGPSATDRGSGPTADPGLEGMPTYPNDMDEELGTELILTLKPEVLAQLQRIEDMLNKVSTGTVTCPHCGDASHPWSYLDG